MDELIIRLAKQREIVAQYEAEAKQIREEIKALGLSQRLKQVYELLDVAKEDAAYTEVEVHEAAIAIYKEKTVKAVHDAVNVKIYTVPIYHEGTAFDYARQHLPQALTFNKREFEKAAKVLQLAFVTLTQEPRVTIARDLSRWNGVGADDQ